MDHSAAASTTLASAGWTLSRAILRSPGSEASLAAGPAEADPLTGAPRGLLGVVSQTLEDAPGAGRPALVALLGLIEGFYGARPTLSQGQAMAQALIAINRWMYAQRGPEGREAGSAAALSAIVFSGRRAGLLQIGGGLILRRRGEEVTRLAEPQLRRLPDGGLAVRRSLGTDSRLLLDYREEPVLEGDRYILLSDTRRPAEDGENKEAIEGRDLCALCAEDRPALAIAEALAAFPAMSAATPPQRAVLVIDVEAMPPASTASAEASLGDLPLAPVPKEGENRDGYRIGRTLHRGAYTLLKYATDLHSRQPVVLKFPLPAMLHDRVFQAGFARETWIGTTIHSPFIARIIPPEPGRRSSLYIVMPYYPGETLEARIAREPRFALADIVAIALQLCQAVEDLRAIQVLHRDLKPENVMLVTGGGLRLLDLGLAYLAGVESEAAHGLAGTIRYMAPELLRGSGPDSRSEVYALGVILYRLAALGRFPRPGADIAAALMRARPDLPPELARTIAAAMDPVPARRPQHAGVLAQRISEALRDGTGNRLSPRRKLDPVTVWRTAALLLGLALLVALALR